MDYQIKVHTTDEFKNDFHTVNRLNLENYYHQALYNKRLLDNKNMREGNDSICENTSCTVQVQVSSI